MPEAEASFLEALAGGEVFNILPSGKMVFYAGVGLYYWGKFKESKTQKKQVQ